MGRSRPDLFFEVGLMRLIFWILKQQIPPLSLGSLSPVSVFLWNSLAFRDRRSVNLPKETSGTTHRPRAAARHDHHHAAARRERRARPGLRPREVSRRPPALPAPRRRQSRAALCPSGYPFAPTSSSSIRASLTSPGSTSSPVALAKSTARSASMLSITTGPFRNAASSEA